MSQRKQTTTKEKSHYIKFLYIILWFCALLILLFHWIIYWMKLKNEYDKEQRIKDLENALINNNLSQEVWRQKQLWLNNKEYNVDEYIEDSKNKEEIKKLNDLINSSVKNLDKILWENYEDEIDLKDDYQNMSIRIESIWVFSPIVDTNYLSDEDYYKTIRTNTALKWSFPRMNWITHISAHSSVPMYNRHWIQDIFKNLKNINVWDKVEIFSEKYKYVYEVTNVYKKWFDDLWNLFEQTVKNKLVLMTCPDFRDKDFHSSREFAVWYLKDIQTIWWKSIFWIQDE